MSADTTFYAKIPITEYVWVKAYGVTSDDVLRLYPTAVEVKHWSEYEEDSDD